MHKSSALVFLFLSAYILGLFWHQFHHFDSNLLLIFSVYLLEVTFKFSSERNYYKYVKYVQTMKENNLYENILGH